MKNRIFKGAGVAIVTPMNEGYVRQLQQIGGNDRLSDRKPHRCDYYLRYHR